MGQIKTLYMVGIVRHTLTIKDERSNECHTIPCSWADGMIGAFPCFYDLEQAKAYAPGHEDKIMDFKVEVPDAM